jgi:hypothetical protein
MSARAVLANASAKGVEVVTQGEQLSVRGQQEAVAAVLPDIKAYKAEIIAFLGKPIHRGLPKDLERRIEFVAQFHGFTAEELAEAKEIAAGDIENAIPCFRALVAKILAIDN